MTEPSTKSASTRVSKIIKASRKAVYRAFLDPDSVAAWFHPDGMTGHVHTFEPREGGKFRISLTYQDAKNSSGKTSQGTDTYQGRFVKLVSNETIVEVIEFESKEPGFAGEMRMTVTLADADGGTEVTVLSEDIPGGIRPEDNETGGRMALQNLAAFLE